MSLTLGVNSEAEALVTKRNLMEGNCFDEGTVMEEGEAKGDFKGNRDRNRRGDWDISEGSFGDWTVCASITAIASIVLE